MPSRNIIQIALALQVYDSHQERIQQGILEFAKQRGDWRFAFNPDGNRFDINKLRDWKQDGVIAMVETPQQVRQAKALKVPVVNVSGMFETVGLLTVTTDDYALGCIAAEHMMERGFQRYAYYGLKDVWYSNERCRGFTETVSAGGFPCSTYFSPSSNSEPRPWQWDVQPLEEWLLSIDTPVGLMAAHDYRAFMILEVCKHLGLNVPDQVAVIGVDQNPVTCEFSDPQLTSVAQDGYAIGFKAAALLDALLQDSDLPQGPFRVAPGPIFYRKSTDTVAIEDPRLRRPIDMMRECFAEPIGIDQIASRVNVTRRWLEKLFRTHVGCSPNQFLTRLRIMHAKQLLVQERHTKLTSIAKRCGFGELRRMNSVFLREIGESPRVYRMRVANAPRGRISE